MLNTIEFKEDLPNLSSDSIYSGISRLPGRTRSYRHFQICTQISLNVRTGVAADIGKRNKDVDRPNPAFF